MTPEKLSEIREMCRHDPEASARAAMMLADALEAAEAQAAERWRIAEMYRAEREDARARLREADIELATLRGRIGRVEDERDRLALSRETGWAKADAEFLAGVGLGQRAEAAEATIRRLELVPSWGARDVDPDALVLLVADFDAALRGEADRPAEVCARPGTHDWKPVYDAPLLYCGWCRATKPDPARGEGGR